MLITPAEQTVLNSIRADQEEQTVLIDLYIEIRNYLIGGDITNYSSIFNKKRICYGIDINNNHSDITIHWVESYSGRPGKPIICFIFPEINKVSADICYSGGFHVNLRYAMEGENLDVHPVPEGWTKWQESPPNLTAEWIKLSNINKPVSQVPQLRNGIDHWKRIWGIRNSYSP